MWWILLLLFIVGAGATGVWLLWTGLPGWWRRRRLLQAQRKALVGPASSRWAEGEDLHRYPRRLEELERRLAESHVSAVKQGEHLKGREAEVGAKEGRGELVQRYRDDALLLERRAERMRRVLGLVWKTRALLTVRTHLAVTARRRPDLGGLPDDDVGPARLEGAAKAYDGAAEHVRTFVGHLEERLGELAASIPQPPSDADVTSEMWEEVHREEERVGAAYRELRGRMDHLADNLAYLADRCRTRKVVEGTPGAIESEPGSEALLDKVTEALESLNDLSRTGDKRLADLAVDNLAEDITQLEKAGLEAEAEAEAALEVARLLEQFEH